LLHIDSFQTNLAKSLILISIENPLNQEAPYQEPNSPRTSDAEEHRIKPSLYAKQAVHIKELQAELSAANDFVTDALSKFRQVEHRENYLLDRIDGASNDMQCI
jgi:predicted transcriptional regulator